MTIKEILERHAKGLPVAGSKRIPMYTGEELLPDLQRMDISEIQDLKGRINNAITEAQENLAKAEAEKTRKIQLEAIKLELMKEIEEKQKGNPPAPSAGGDSA